MSHYIKQEHDFVKRTIKILDQYNKLNLPKNDKYEVTLLINCLTGLIILPQQEWYNRLPTEIIESKKWGIGTEHISFIEKGKQKTVRYVITKIRNSISHYNFKVFSNSKKELSQIKIIDKNQVKEKTFEATIPIKNFRKFIGCLSLTIKEMMEDG